MSIAFARTMRSLNADHFRRSGAGLLMVVLLLAGWGWWFARARVSRYEVSDTARLEVDRATIPSGNLRVVADFPPPAALGRIHVGQPARLRLLGFPGAQYGAIRAQVTSVGSQVRDGRVRVELAVLPEAHSPIPLQHGLPGTVEIEVERVSPAILALRAAGWLAAQPAGSPSP